MDLCLVAKRIVAVDIYPSKSWCVTGFKLLKSSSTTVTTVCASHSGFILQRQHESSSLTHI